jgi:UPF0755 protein
MIKRVLIALLLLLLILIVVAYFMVNAQIGDPQANYKIKVERSDNAANVRAKLIAAGLDVNPTVYSILMVLTKSDRNIRPGYYEIPGRLNQLELVRWFREENVLTSKVTVPEGLTVKEIIPILSHGVPADSTQLAHILVDSIYWASFGIAAPSFEGYLFPETYKFFYEEEPEYVIHTMVNMFKSVYDSTWQQRAKEIGMTENEVVTLASLIEAETGSSDERKLISSVFHNRLKRGIMLQCDPTVIYAMGGLDRPLMKTDLTYDSPYNTYTHYGLPPGPICCPGRASLEAALYPADTDYLYFVADGTGSHIFSETLEAHNRARARIKRESRLHR